MSLFHHIHVDNHASRTLFLLHGTGGTEHDFLFLDDGLEKQYNLVGIRGNSTDEGMNRFFRRTAPGVFDQENIKEEAAKLFQFVSEWQRIHALDNKHTFFLGYSNGANMLLASCFYYPKQFTNLVLLHPMLPFKPTTPLDLAAHHILITHGEHDAMVPTEQQKDIGRVLQSGHAHLTEKVYDAGHEMTEAELRDVLQWLRGT